MAKRGRPAHPDVLTPTEWRVLDAVRHGMSNRTIARRRGVSLDAVKYHVKNHRGTAEREAAEALNREFRSIRAPRSGTCGRRGAAEERR